MDQRRIQEVTSVKHPFEAVDKYQNVFIGIS